MKEKFFTTFALLAICVATIIITIQFAKTGLVRADEFENPNQQSSIADVALDNQRLILSRTCAVKPEKNRRSTPPPTSVVAPGQISLERFRNIQSSPSNLSENKVNYAPKESIKLANPTNYGERYVFDLYGKSAYYDPIIVLHETVGSASSAINFFLTRHPLEADQVSYHTLIKRNGEVVYLVPPDKRAFGAGNSVFEGELGKEAVKTHPDYPASVNNFAYHISLETPRDGNDNGSRHSGYTQAQYQSLAWIVAKTGVPNNRITTHKIVDRSGQRQDPRSFNSMMFLRLLQAQPKTNEIIIDCQRPS